MIDWAAAKIADYFAGEIVKDYEGPA